jgi:hypothetical protein
MKRNQKGRQCCALFKPTAEIYGFCGTICRRDARSLRRVSYQAGTQTWPVAVKVSPQPVQTAVAAAE